MESLASLTLKLTVRTCRLRVTATVKSSLNLIRASRLVSRIARCRTIGPA